MKEPSTCGKIITFRHSPLRNGWPAAFKPARTGRCKLQIRYQVPSSLARNQKVVFGQRPNPCYLGTFLNSRSARFGHVISLLSH